MKNRLISFLENFLKILKKKEISSDIDLKRALRLIKQAGYPDPTKGTRNQKELLQQVITTLCDLSLHDGLTGLVTPKHFRAALERECERAIRTSQSLSLLLLDLDHFKRVNDTYGHLTGDHVLQTVANHIRSSIRTMDTPARYGGEEFSVILPNTSSDAAEMIAERIRTKIQKELICTEDHSPIQVTVSVGISFLSPHIPNKGKDLIKKADMQLYQAKARGRNCICSDVSPSMAVTRQEKAVLWDQPGGVKKKP